MNGFKALNWKKCYLIGHLTKKKKSERERLKKERSGGLHLSYIAVLIVKSYL